jgi:MATE family multidrug resistance protein
MEPSTNIPSLVESHSKLSKLTQDLPIYRRSANLLSPPLLLDLENRGRRLSYIPFPVTPPNLQPTNLYTVSCAPNTTTKTLQVPSLVPNVERPRAITLGVPPTLALDYEDETRTPPKVSRMVTLDIPTEEYQPNRLHTNTSSALPNIEQNEKELQQTPPLLRRKLPESITDVPLQKRPLSVVLEAKIPSPDSNEPPPLFRRQLESVIPVESPLEEPIRRGVNFDTPTGDSTPRKYPSRKDSPTSSIPNFHKPDREPHVVVKYLKSFRHELWEMLKIIIPALIVHSCFVGMDLCDIIFLGHLPNPNYLAGSTIAGALSFTLMTIPSGMVGAQETLVAQAYGANNRAVMRIVLYRSILLTLIVFIPIMTIFAFANYLFIPVVLPDELDVAYYAAKYLYLTMPGLIPISIFRILSSYLISQDNLLIPSIVGIIGLGLNILLNFLLVTGIDYNGLGFVGSPIATSISRVLCLMLMLIALLIRAIVRHVKGEEGFFLSDLSFLSTIKAAFMWDGVKEYLELAIPSSFLLCMDFGCFEIISLVAARFGENYVSSHAILVNISFVTYAFSSAIAAAAGARVGNMLGSQEHERGKWLTWISIFIGIGIMSCCAVVIASCRYFIAELFTPGVDDVINIVANVMPILAIFQVFDGAQTVSNGVLRGMGRQRICVVTSFVGFYIVGLPTGALLAFLADLKLFGFWCGLASALIFIAIVLITYIITNVKWEGEADYALARVNVQSTKFESGFDIMAIEQAQKSAIAKPAIVLLNNNTPMVMNLDLSGVKRMPSRSNLKKTASSGNLTARIRVR